jgi:mannose-1-phosphate guanylyltransferase
MDDFYAVIMAGGGGTRLWPMSRKSRPKQTLRLIDERPLFRIAIDRISSLIPLKRILVVTVEEQAEQLGEIVPELPSTNYLLEPSPKGTASVVGLAATYLDNLDSESVMAVLTADHFIKNEEQFLLLLKAAYEVAKKDNLVTLGISPTYASTGYGYIHRGKKLGQIDGFRYYQSLGFREKPPLDVAEKYVDSGDYSWNSGMFIWKSNRILAEINRYMPELANGLTKIRSSFSTPEHSTVLAKEWERIKSETIDYGIMEKAERVVIFPAEDLGWTDIGSWDRIFEILKGDESGNIILSDSSILIDTSESMVVKDESKAHDRLIALMGVDNLVVIDAGDVVLVCSRDRAEEVRTIVKMLSDQGMESYL